MLPVPEPIFDRIVEDVKRLEVNGANLWPRYSDPEPDYFTGEVLFRPKSRADLNDAEIHGIVQWLETYMIEKGIPRHAPEMEGTWQ